MRVQLIVQRHGLPSTQVLWTVGQTNPQAPSASFTTSQFLEQVNDIIPLEADDWGLEDYCVEVGGFECLHFSELNHVLKEDDEVCIRPLQTSDLRVRKVSGRHQISEDGKHLIDGVAFGRPFLRKAARPAIRIPPRKRRQITYDEEDDPDSMDIYGNRQVVVRAGTENADTANSEHEDDEDEDFVHEDEEEDLDQELEDLQEDAGVEQVTTGAQGRSRRIARQRQDPQGLGLLRLVDDIGRPFDGIYSNPLLDMYSQDEPSQETPNIQVGNHDRKNRKSRPTKPTKSSVQDQPKHSEEVCRRSSSGSNKSVRFEGAERGTPATILESKDSDDNEDDDFEPEETDESDKENAEPREDIPASQDDLLETSGSDSSSSSDFRPLDNDETSSSGPSSDSDSDQDPNPASNHDSKTSSTSSSGSSSSSSKYEHEDNREKEAPEESSSKFSPEGPVIEVSKSQPASSQSVVAPGEGLSQTQIRNRRRKESRKLKSMKEKKILPAEATKADLRNFCATNGNASLRSKITRSLDGENKADEAMRLENPTLEQAEKISTLRADDPTIAPEEGSGPATKDSAEPTGNEEPMLDAESKADVVEYPAAKAPEADAHAALPAQNQQSDDAERATIEATDTNDATTTALSEEIPSATATSIPALQPRRAKLDLASSKRLLFGSLGLRAPKTAEDESRLREKLMKDIKPIKETKVDNEAIPVMDSATVLEDESWKEKIDLRAVECCYDGVELSTPPFPFYQRWDPQQQRGYGKKRKEKKRKRNDYSYYEDEFYDFYDDSFNNDSRKKAARSQYYVPTDEAPQFQHSASENQVMSEEVGPYDQILEYSQAANDQLIRETTESVINTAGGAEVDLPSLPEDTCTCAKLKEEACKTGTIIAFKKLEMSPKTNWQPVISDYKTALIDRFLVDRILQMTLAKRDSPSKQLHYDEMTGERVYQKLEMPGYDDEGAEDDGKITIFFEELIDPILIRAVEEPPPDLSDDKDDRIPPDDAEEKDDGIADELNGPRELSGAEDDQQTSTRPLVPGLDGAMDNPEPRQIAGPTEQARQEISELIRDAGWRSSLPTEVRNDLAVLRDDNPAQEDYDREDTTLIDPPSPRFNGFGSSPLGDAQSQSSPIFGANQSGLAPADENADSNPPRDSNESNAQSGHSSADSTVEYPSLPLLNDDSNIFQDERQHRSISIERETHFSSENLLSPPALRRDRQRTPLAGLSQPKIVPKAINTLSGNVSDDEFPELFSQAFEARLSQDTEFKPEHHDDDVIQTLPKRKSKAEWG